ncbi:MAG TPA: PQQ-binding-like beta-propeller repeat protein [Pyrinomonadaceae bacterium]
MKLFQEWLKPIFLLLVLAPVPAMADWPQFRGPNRDGNIAGLNLPKGWPKVLKETWKVTVGVGHSSPLLVDGRVFVFARQGEEEVLMALDASTGKELWRSSNAIAYEMNSAALGHGKGPKSTPVVWNNRIYTFGITGVLSAHDAKIGKLIWRREFSKQFPATSPLYGTAMSPVIERGLLIAHVGGHDKGALVAFDVNTGEPRWTYDGDGPAYASPIVVTLAGMRQVVTFTQKELISVDAANGKLLWKFPAKTAYDTNSITPIVYRDTLIISREELGLSALRIEREKTELVPREVWNNRENPLYLSTPILQNNRLVGFSVRNRGMFFALDPDSGQTLWQSPGRIAENAALLGIEPSVLALTTNATLVVINSANKTFETQGELEVAQSATWAHPVISRERILVKDETTLRSLSLPASRSVMERGRY